MRKNLCMLLAFGITTAMLAGCNNSDNTSTSIATDSDSQNQISEESGIAHEILDSQSQTAENESEITQANASQSQEVTDYGDLVVTIPTETNEILLYYPTPNAADTLGVITVCTSPSLLVFADEKVDETEAVRYANESGLAKLAAENGSSVCFVNPTDETWSEKDANAYANAAASILSTTQDPIENGVITRIDGETQEEVLAIAGNQSRIYVYGIGKGADYIANNALKDVSVKMFYGYDVNVTPAACSLENCTDVTDIEKNDIPIVSINNSNEINNILEENCGSVLAEDGENYEAQYNQVIKHYRRMNSVLINVYDWEDEGIVESVESCEVTTSPDNASPSYAGTQSHPVNYIVYYSEDLDVVNGNVPLVMIFHGGGNSALHESMMTDWPMIGKEGGFITCSVDSHYPDCTATEIIELIDDLKSEYSIDESRIYASGFSMGGVKCWDLYEQYPDVFAGLAPMDASSVVGTDSYENPVENVNSDTLVPLFYVGGETSPLEELPFQSEKVTERIRQVFNVNNIVTPYEAEFSDAENWTNKIWGIDGDITYEITDTVFTDSVLTVQLFKSEDGHYYTALASASNQAHDIYARNSWAAWDFLSQFSRNAKGGIDIEQVEYNLPSDDGSVVDNQYNY